MPKAEHWPIHRLPPKFKDQSTKSEIFETGIKVIDLMAPFIKGGKVGLFGGGHVWPSGDQYLSVQKIGPVFMTYHLTKCGSFFLSIRWSKL